MTARLFAMMLRLRYMLGIVAIVVLGLVSLVTLVQLPVESVDALSCESEPATEFVDGIYEVGCEVAEGVYVAAGFDGTCRIAVAESDAATRALAWVGRAVFEVGMDDPDANGMTRIESDGCGAWRLREESLAEPFLEFGEGAFEVGSDILPGVYESSVDSERCFWFYVQDWSYRDTSGTAVVVWLIGQPVVEIPEDAVGFYSARCGTWSMRAPDSPATSATGFADGSYVSGLDMAPGRYVSEGPVDDRGECIWYRTSPVTAGGGATASGGHQSSGRQIAEISEWDVGFYSSGCGDWRPFSADDDEDVPRWSEFVDGTYIVGADIAADTYVAESVEGLRCRWEVLSGFGGSGAEVTRSGVGLARGIVKIESADAGFRSAGCETWRTLDDARLAEMLAEFPDGEYAVGVHIAPGLYVSDGAIVGRCFWRRVSDFTWDDNEVLGIRNQVGRVVARVTESDAGFESLGCGTWRRHDDVVFSAGPLTSFVHGTWLVGSEVRPGLYSARLRMDDICFWGRFSDFTGSGDALLAAGVAEGSALVMLDGDDVGVYSDGCGTWVLESALPERVAVDTFGDGVHLVGSEILPGTYVSRSRDDEVCIWSRLAGFRGTDLERTATFSSDGISLVTIRDSDMGFRSWGCETWRRFVPDTDADRAVVTPGMFADGLHIVGRDVAPGLYRATDHEDVRCKWVRLSDWSWTVGIIAERLQREIAVAEIATTDAGFFSEGCGEWEPVDATQSESAMPLAEFGDGSHLVGVDIAPGLYRSDQQFEVGSCRWARLSAFSGIRDDQIAGNGSEEGDWIVEIKEDDAGFESRGCGTWSQVAVPGEDVASESLTLASEFGDGAYRVGVDIAPGTYEADIGTAQYRGGQYVPACRWSRVSGFGHESGDVVEADAGWGVRRVVVRAGDVGVVSEGCGVWGRVE